MIENNFVFKTKNTLGNKVKLIIVCLFYDEAIILVIPYSPKKIIKISNAYFGKQKRTIVFTI